MSNIQTLKVGATTPLKKTSVFISGTTHAMYIQKVILHVTDADNNKTTHVFQGSGEGTSFPNPYTANSLPLPAEFTFEFLYSSDGGNTFNPANFSKQSTLIHHKVLEAYSLFSEDATDKDDNDSYMIASFHHGY